MKISFYAPFKPLDHPNPSGDQVTARDIVGHLEARGHIVIAASRFRCRWIYWKPWLWPALVREQARAVRHCRRERPDIWLTYHSYYKAPDLIGPIAARKTRIPYVVFQGIYSTKRRRRLSSVCGFYLNRHALTTADHLFTNKTIDRINLQRLVSADKITHIPPGIRPDEFVSSLPARNRLRARWGVDDKTPVVLSVAMFRPGVKAEGLAWVIRACADISRRGHRLKLVIVGDGAEKARLASLAADCLPEHTIFAGKIPRTELYRYCSAADIFAFPGIQESLGLVYLEAQSCGLPVVAVDNAGVPEAVAHGKTGLLSAPFSFGGFTDNLARLITDDRLRRSLGRAAERHVRQFRDLERNYRELENQLARIAHRRRRHSWSSTRIVARG